MDIKTRRGSRKTDENTKFELVFALFFVLYCLMAAFIKFPNKICKSAEHGKANKTNSAMIAKNILVQNKWSKMDSLKNQSLPSLKYLSKNGFTKFKFDSIKNLHKIKNRPYFWNTRNLLLKESDSINFVFPNIDKSKN